MFIVKDKRTGNYVAKNTRYGEWPKFTEARQKARTYNNKGHILTSIGEEVISNHEEYFECPTCKRIGRVCHIPTTSTKSKLVMPEWAEIIEVTV